ncbi:hypothetical protein [Lamprocystis purpurea]|jgi:hypothetical protein|uniref:hypothetical protein n=1 Tax=Lamprocystis purpurea TaxID=61598 RepID=UPI0012FA6CC9|nr:hypothetical protein [Lamprocystis purpurea]
MHSIRKLKHTVNLFGGSVLAALAFVACSGAPAVSLPYKKLAEDSCNLVRNLIWADHAANEKEISEPTNCEKTGENADALYTVRVTIQSVPNTAALEFEEDNKRQADAAESLTKIVNSYSLEDVNKKRAQYGLPPLSSLSELPGPKMPSQPRRPEQEAIKAWEQKHYGPDGILTEIARTNFQQGRDKLLISDDLAHRSSSSIPSASGRNISCSTVGDGKDPVFYCREDNKNGSRVYSYSFGLAPNQ